MDRGIYINQKNEVVFAGNRKKTDPSGLNWKKISENDLPNQLIDLGVHMWICPGSDVIENPDYTIAKDAADVETARMEEIETEKENSGLNNFTVSQVYGVIDAAKDLDDIKIILKKMIIRLK